MNSTLSIDYEKIQKSYTFKKVLSRLLIGAAISLTLSPLLLRDKLNNNAKLVLSLSGFIFSLCCTKLPSTDYESKLLKTYKDTKQKQYKTVLQGEILSHQSELEIANQQKLAETIENLPDYQVPYFAAKYGVAPLIAANYISESEPSEKVPETATISAPKTIFESVIEREEKEAGTELTWLKNATYQSCFLAGKKRSGKTFLMKWLLKAFISNCRGQDIFYISDPHYDSDDPWINFELDNKLIQNRRLVKTETDTLQMINEVLGAIKARKTQGLTTKKGVGLIRIFMDEIDSYSTEIQEELSNFIKVVEYEAAKYGITVVLGAHSIKKGEMGIDSSVISSMLCVLFPSVVLDRNSVLSGSFPSLPVLRKMIEKYKIESLPNDGRLVVIGNDTEVFISHIPNLNQVEVKTEEEREEIVNKPANPVLQIKKWCDLCFEQYQRYPSPELIKKAWLEYTGQELTEQALQLLIEKLGIK
jgi:hypothetical protein